MSGIRQITERFSFPSGLNVDRTNNAITGVKLLGWESKNNRKYQESCGKNVDKYSGAFVNIDHEQKSTSSRFGRVFDPVVKPDGIYGSIRYNPKHQLAEQILWFAENDPSAIGMSHDADGKVVEEPDGSWTITEIVNVRSVDIVSDPATTKGLHESMNDNVLTPADPKMDFKAQVGELAKSLFTSDEFNTKEVHAKLKHLLKLCDEAAKGEGSAEDYSDDDTETDTEEGDETPAEDDEKKAKESVETEMKKLKAQLDVYQVKEALDNKRKLAKKLCDAAQLPTVAVTEQFLNDLTEKKDEASMRESIEDRRKVLNLTGKTKPTSAGHDSKPAPQSLDDFCKSLVDNQD